MLESVLDVLFLIGLTLGVGSSTFALTFFIRAFEDGVIDASERRFMHTVYFVLRIGMATIFGTLMAKLVFFYTTFEIADWTQLFLLFVITSNALLMQFHLMSMKFGPVIAGGSWYTLFFVSALPREYFSLFAYTLIYIGVLALVFVILGYCKRRFTLLPDAFTGEIAKDEKTLEAYSRDASSFTLTPQAVYYPRNVHDVAVLTHLCREAKKKGQEISLTPRAGGTCMSGGSLNTGWIVDLTQHMHKIKIDKKKKTATVEMGAFFRDIEDKAAKKGLMFAAYPSSHRVCGIGGMIGNNASGEKSLRHGATGDNVLELEVVLADGTVTNIAPKDISEITDERERAIHTLAEKYGEKLRKATGDVKKSASGYRLEKVLNGNVFNAVPLFVGGQGTLGIITKAVLKLVPIPQHLELVVISAQSMKDISPIIQTVLEHNPEGLETFDSNTYEQAKKHLTKCTDKLVPYLDEKAHIFILAQFSEESPASTHAQAQACIKQLNEKGYTAVKHIIDPDEVDAAWQIRRNSFLLMRDYNPEGHKAVPCIEDVIVPLPALGKFIEGLVKILKEKTAHYGFHGHIGDGSLRIIPVFDFTKPTVSEDIEILMKEVFVLVKRLKGNISADHNDGIVRTPFLKAFYGKELHGAFEQIKEIYDPLNIMNPNKKVCGTMDHFNDSLDSK